ncbi:MAG: PD40 domain-containing protein, partial [Verrucomicrobiae bacterium]|nr:PD40 domain-containing protein [Verrucomicrobiae bacterium]
MLQSLQGPGGTNATPRIAQLLERTSPFQLTQGQSGCPIVGGTAGAGFLEGTLSSADGHPLFHRKYQSGSLELDSRQFVDDIVYTLTKRPSIATSQIAFAFTDAGKPHQVYVCDYDGGNVRQITRTGAYVAPALSPDGTSLAAVSLQNGGAGIVEVIDLTKGRPQRPRMPPSQRIRMAYSPNGEQLALSMIQGPGQNSDLFLVNLPRGRLQPLTQTPVPESCPSWSPEGNRLVFSAAPAPG